MGTYTQFQLLHDDLPDVAIKIRDIPYSVRDNKSASALAWSVDPLGT